MDILYVYTMYATIEDVIAMFAAHVSCVMQY